MNQFYISGVTGTIAKISGTPSHAVSSYQINSDTYGTFMINGFHLLNDYNIRDVDIAIDQNQRSPLIGIIEYYVQHKPSYIQIISAQQIAHERHDWNGLITEVKIRRAYFIFIRGKLELLGYFCREVRKYVNLPKPLLN